MTEQRQRRDDVTTQIDLASQIGRSEPEDQRAYLVLRTTALAEVKVLAEGASMVLGRAEDADIVVDDSRVSRRNTEIALRGRRLVVRDLGGRNGTRVNGAVLRNDERVVVRGDEITVGPARVTIAAVPGASPGATPATMPPTGNTTPAEIVTGDFVAEDPKVKELFALAEKLARVPTSVLIRGETGVGKELVAERLHEGGPRARGPIVRLNCAAVPESLLESELFGHEKGAFTGANERKRGMVEAANGGTLFLDEIGDLSLPMQAKLLRVLETQRVQPVGARDEVQVDVRFVAATHRDVDAMVADGTFRRDLYFRLAGFVLDVPPLRARLADIAPLAARFAAAFAIKIGRAVAPQIDPEVVALLRSHAWPGNARELRNAMEHAIVLATGATLHVEHLPEALRSVRDATRGASMQDDVDGAERRSVERALEAAGGNRARAAEILGVSKRTLQYRLAKWGSR